MKYIQLILLLSLACVLLGQKPTDVLMKVGDEQVTVGEFQYIYEKNNGDNADYSKESLEEYLELYKKFKLKVAKAKDMKLDTIKALQQELAGYRDQLANSYLMDKEVMNNLYKELYQRMDWDVRVSHILVQVPKKPKDEDWKDAEEKANKIFERLRNGEDYEKLALELSDDKFSGKNGGDIGYYTAMMPAGFYQMENAMYNTRVGDIAAPVKSKLGFHIVKVTNKRPAKGKVSVSQILVRKTKKQSSLMAQTAIDEAYEKLVNGESFEDMVRLYSEDKKTRTNQGALPEFGIRQYSKAFEDSAFALEKVGDFSKPFETKLGWHILYKNKHVEKDPFEIFKRKVEPQVKKDERYEMAKNELINDIKRNADYKLNQGTLDKFLGKIGEDFFSYKWQFEKGAYLKETLFTLGDSETKLEEFAKYCKKNTRERLRSKKSKSAGEVVNDLIIKYSDEAALKYEKENLEERYPDFKSLMREYEEGILLFEATKISVWDKANQDTLGLYEYYEKHNKKYMWEERAELSKYIIHSSDKDLAEKIQKYIKKNEPEKVMAKFNKDDEIIEYSTVKYDRAGKELNGMKREEGEVSNIVSDSRSNLQLIRKIERIIPARRKTLEEARGYVVADYQSELEKNWIKKLNREFSIEVDKKTFKKLIKQ